MKKWNGVRIVEGFRFVILLNFNHGMEIKNVINEMKAQKYCSLLPKNSQRLNQLPKEYLFLSINY